MKSDYVKTFLKGLLMGVCDAIPGISGGTIAFITGIYERLINAIKGFSLNFFYGLLLFLIDKGNKKEVKQNLRAIDIGFLVTLLAGILIALIVFSRVMSFLLEGYFSLTMAFFVGLILASAKTIFNHIERHHTVNTIFMLVGLALGISLVFIVPASVNPGIWYVVLGGFLAISAMVLPGISGSFILLLLGIYQFMINVIKNFPEKIDYIVAFIVGALVGLFTISRVVSWLFKKDKSKTLYFLLGLVVGGLSVPLKSIIEGGFTTILIVQYIVLFVLGVLAASLITRLAKK
ncbi:MAG: DUF368 domain-containing protein [archaeon]